MITVTWVTRNDDHGGNLLPRIQASLNALGEYREAGVNVELVIVEWNPPYEASLLYDALTVPVCLPVRWYYVPGSVHDAYPNHEQFVMWNHIGTNVGMRRAKGDWVLATTHDILWSHQLAQLLAEEAFDSGSFYRAPRHDGSITYQTGATVAENIAELVSGEVVKKDYDGHGFFTRSCGDFILMSRERWHMMRGYPEWPINGIWLDGLIMHIANVSGLLQEVLPAPAYHMNHENGGLQIYNALPHMPRSDYQRVCAEMLKTRKVPAINGEPWGLGDAAEFRLATNRFVLSEHVVHTAPKLW